MLTRNNFICYNRCSETVEDPCRKGLSFMTKSKKVIEAVSEPLMTKFEEKINRLLEDGYTILSVGHEESMTSDYEDWWAILLKED